MNWTAEQVRARVRDNPHLQVLPPIRGTGGAARGLARPAAVPALTPPPALEELFQTIQILATRHGWANAYSYNPEGDDAGLHVILARDVMLHAEVVTAPEALTPHQQAWLAAVRATGQGEAYAWTPADIPQIRARLSRPRRTP